MKRSVRYLALATATLSCVSAYAQQTLVKLSSYPSVSVSDSRSTTTITAELRDSAGRVVPDGTRVVFNSTLGTFRESVINTLNGVARAVLVSGAQPGIARITATPLSGTASPGQLEFEFVANREMLSSAKEYIEFVAPGIMHYTSDTRIIGASGADKGVNLRYRDITVDANDMQFNLARFELRARKARLKIGKQVREYDALFMRLNQRKGYGITTYTTHRTKFPVLVPHGIGYAYLDRDEKLAFDTPPEEERYGVVEVRLTEDVPTRAQPPADAFEMTDLSFATSRVSAKKAVIFPNKQIQFHRAEIYVADTKVMRLPLFQLSLLGGNSPLITDQLVNVSDNNVAINYPHFLSLKPGQTSLLRFRTGDSYGRGLGTSRGAFLDFETTWNHGDAMDGGLTFRGIGRSDWGLGFRQFNRFDDRTSGFVQLDMPAGKSLFGSGSLARQFPGYQVSLSANANRSIRGLNYSSQDLSLVAEKDPIKMGALPFQLFYGLTANTSSTKYEGSEARSQTSTGVRTRLQSLPITLDKKSTITTSLSASKVAGQNVGSGFQFQGNATLSRRITNSASAILAYDYTQDGYNDAVAGKHRLSAQSYMNSGRTGIRLFGSRSLDVDRMNMFADLEYRPKKEWVLRSSYTFDHYSDQFGGSSFLDTQISFGYIIGWREVGLVYSRRTKRIGIQLLGAGGF